MSERACDKTDQGEGARRLGGTRSHIKGQGTVMRVRVRVRVRVKPLLWKTTHSIYR